MPVSDAICQIDPLLYQLYDFTDDEIANIAC